MQSERLYVKDEVRSDLPDSMTVIRRSILSASMHMVETVDALLHLVKEGIFLGFLQRTDYFSSACARYSQSPICQFNRSLRIRGGGDFILIKIILLMKSMLYGGLALTNNVYALSALRLLKDTKVFI